MELIAAEGVLEYAVSDGRSGPAYPPHVQFALGVKTFELRSRRPDCRRLQTGEGAQSGKRAEKERSWRRLPFSRRLR